MRPQRTDGPPEEEAPEERRVREPAAEAPPTAPDPQARFTDMMRAISLILSARAIFGATVAGAFMLGLVAMIWPNWIKLAALGLYGLTAVAPAAWLELRRSR